MKYICCLWLCFVWLVCNVQYGVYGLHVQQAPEIIQRITRQATRYGSGGSVSGPNYRPVPGPSSNYNVRNIASDLTTSLTSSQLNSVAGNSGQRPTGVGAYTFGGMASGRPTNGNSFAVSNSVKNSGLRTSQTSSGQTIVGSGSVNGGGTAGRPQQLQHALMQAAQYQLQQHQQLRRQMPQQQLYRHRPTNNYQQYN